MRTTRTTVIGSLLLSFNLLACQSLSSSTRLQQVEQEIRQVDQARTDALRSGDVAALANLYADDFMMITSTGEIRSKQDQLRDISSKLYQHQGPPAKILRLRIYGTVAVVEAESKGELVVNGQADDVLRRYTRVYVKNNGQWQLTATHISRVAQP